VEIAEEFRTVCFIGIHPLHFFNAETETSTASACSEQTGVWLRFSGDNVCLADHTSSARGSSAGLPVLLGDVLRSRLCGSPRIVGIGECGLDFYRKSNRAEQIAVFKTHLELAKHSNLPYFFHCRSAFGDFISCLDAAPSNTIRGVVHSFDGTLRQAQDLICRGFYIGINGCSMRTEENVAVVRSIPLGRILLETDSPYCLIRKSYHCSTFTRILKAKYNEPRHVACVAEAVANIKGISLIEVEERVYQNTTDLFPSIKAYSEQFLNVQAGSEGK
jgi:TatD family hydrolase